MNRRDLLKTGGTAAVITAASRAYGATTDARQIGSLNSYLGRYSLPALAAAAVVGGGVVAVGAVGTRRAGANIPVSLDDRFHIGSDGKAMTALLAAMLIEAGNLGWDTTVAAIFPELAGTMGEGVGSIRVDQLLSHTSG